MIQYAVAYRDWYVQVVGGRPKQRKHPLAFYVPGEASWDSALERHRALGLAGLEDAALGWLEVDADTVLLAPGVPPEDE